MSKVGMTKGLAPPTPPANVVYLYVKADGRFYFKDETGAEEPLKIDYPISALNKVVTGTSYTILAADNGYNLIFTDPAAIAVTLPDGLADNFQCVIVQANTGVPTVTPNTDTINGAGAGLAPADQFKGMYLTKYSATEWLALL